KSASVIFTKARRQEAKGGPRYARPHKDTGAISTAERFSSTELLADRRQVGMHGCNRALPWDYAAFRGAWPRTTAALAGLTTLTVGRECRYAWWAAVHTVLKRRIRRSTITCPPSRPQVIPERFKRSANTVLQAASVTPLPMGRPCRRYVA